MKYLERFRAPLPAPSLGRRLACLLLLLLAGAAVGVLAKWADFSAIQLLGDIFSELPVWIVLGLVIARCSGSPGRAAAALADVIVLRRLNFRDFVLAGLCAVLVFGCKAPRRGSKG